MILTEVEKMAKAAAAVEKRLQDAYPFFAEYCRSVSELAKVLAPTAVAIVQLQQQLAPSLEAAAKCVEELRTSGVLDSIRSIENRHKFS